MHGDTKNLHFGFILLLSGPERRIVLALRGMYIIRLLLLTCESSCYVSNLRRSHC